MPSISSPYKVSEQLYFSTPLVVDWPDSSWTLARIDEFLERQNSVGLVSHFIDGQLRVAFDTAIETLATASAVEFGSKKKSVGMSIPIDHVLSGIHLDLKDVTNQAVLKNQTKVYRNMPSDNLGTIEFIFWKKHTNNSESTSIARADLRVVTYQVKKDFLARDWVKSLPGQLPGLVDSDDRRTALPRLKQVWDEVARMTIADAAQFLTAKQSSTRRSASAFGISVDETLLVTIGPCMIFFVSLYLLAELRNLYNTLNSGSGKSLPIAWIGVYEEPLSRWVSLLSILVLPVASAVTLAAKSEHLFNVRTLLAGTLTLGTAIVAALTVATARKIRIHAQPAPPEERHYDG
jgi:hypothetical protein